MAPPGILPRDMQTQQGAWDDGRTLGIPVASRTVVRVYVLPASVLNASYLNTQDTGWIRMSRNTVPQCAARSRHMVHSAATTVIQPVDWFLITCS